MDKNSLSEWGWIVIIVIILAILIAFAAPFGRFIVTSVQNILDSFVQWSDEAIDDLKPPIDESVLLALGPGLYKTNTTDLIYSWEEMINLGIINSDGVAVEGKKHLLDGYIVFPSTLVVITERAYMDCNNLTGIVLPTGVGGMSIQAFARCSKLSMVVISQEGTFEGMGQEAFYACTDLETFRIPEGAVHVGKSAFAACTSLKSIYFPSTLETMYTNPVVSCPNLEVIEVDVNNTTYHSDGNCLIVTAEKKIFSGCKNSVIPSDGSVTTIGRYSFEGCSIENVVIPEGITSIELGAFDSCVDLKSISIPSSATTIENSILAGCANLESITVDPANTAYSSAGNCLIEKATGNIIAGCGNSVIPNDGSVSSIGAGAFKNNTLLKNVAIPASVTNIGNSAFSGCSNIEIITVEAGNTTYSSAGNCLIETATGKLILGCKNSTIPNDGSVTSIEYQAFANCAGLETFAIPNSITNIGVRAFENCTSLKNIVIDGNNATMKQYVFSGCTSLESATILGGVKNIGSASFDGCNNLHNVTIASGVTTLDASAFYNCPALTILVLPDSINQIKAGAIYGCPRLTTLIVDSNNTTYHSVNNCIIETATEKVVVTCKGSVIPADGSVKIYGPGAIIESEDTSITVPEGITTLMSMAIAMCDNLEEVRLPSTITEIEGNAFSYCPRLTTIHFSGTVSEWESITLGSNWDSDLNNYNIVCTDGTIDKDGTITYN